MAVAQIKASRAQSADEPGETLAQIKRHLGILHHGGTTLILRPKLQALHAAGLIDTFRRHSQDYLGPTDTGRQRGRRHVHGWDSKYPF
jgi:hypothetical protein